MLDFALSEVFMGIHMVVFGEHIKIASEAGAFIPIGTFAWTLDLDRLMVIKRYRMKNFNFLTIFTPLVWLNIFVAILVLAFATTLNNRNFSSMKIFFSKWFYTFYLFLGILSVDSLPGYMTRPLRFRRFLTGLWLLTSVIVIGCLNSSMRDLMSAALQLNVPECLADMVQNTDYAHYVIMLEEAFYQSIIQNTQSDVTNMQYLRDLDEQGRIVIAYMSRCIAEGMSCMGPFFASIFPQFEHMVWLIGPRDRLVGTFATKLYRNYGFLDALEADPEVVFPGGTVAEGVDRFVEVLSYDAHMSSGEDSGREIHLYFPHGTQAPPELVRLYEHFTTMARDYGLIHQIFNLPDELLSLEVSGIAEPVREAEEIKLIDLYGCYLAYFGMTAISVAIFGIELLISRLMKCIEQRKLKKSIKKKKPASEPSSPTSGALFAKSLSRHHRRTIQVVHKVHYK